MEQACTPDLTDRGEVIKHIRDLLNLAPLLERGLDEELRLIIKKLKEIGWGDTQINQILTYSAQGNIFERLKDSEGHRILPRAIPERGDQAEWRLLKPRSK